MTINNLEKFTDSLWDWGILDGCFGDTKIKPSDADGLVERKGHFLLLEAKNPGVIIGQGQRIVFNQLRETGVFTVILVWGEKNTPEEMEVLYEKPLQPTSKKPATLKDLRRVVRWWFHYANSKG